MGNDYYMALKGLVKRTRDCLFYARDEMLTGLQFQDRNIDVPCSMIYFSIMPFRDQHAHANLHQRASFFFIALFTNFPIASLDVS